jgi:hypothetical protein
VARYFAPAGDGAAGQPPRNPAAPSLEDPLGVRASLPVETAPDPAPSPSASVEPKPADPVPVEPKPADPVPVEPKPVAPVPVEPKPADPVPVEPRPVAPAPGEDRPADPAPVEPKPAAPTAPSVLPLSFNNNEQPPAPARAPARAESRSVPAAADAESSRALSGLPLLPPPSRQVPVVGGPDLDVSAVPASSATAPVPPVPARPARSLTLETENDPVLAGRPRWDPKATSASATATATAEPARDLNGSTRWVSELAFTETSKTVRTGKRIVPRPRAAQGERGLPLVGRFFRRVRGAGRAFLHPDLDLIGRETGDLPQYGDGVERASAERLDKAPKR